MGDMIMRSIFTFTIDNDLMKRFSKKVKEDGFMRNTLMESFMESYANEEIRLTFAKVKKEEKNND